MMKVWLSEVKRNVAARQFTGSEKCFAISDSECENS